MKIKKVLMSLFLIVLFVGFSYSQHNKELFVSPKGKDINKGTKSAPLKTLSAARDQVRELRAKNPGLKNEEITIFLREGNYNLNKTLLLEPEDSKLVFRAYKKETPTISGAKLIKNWKQLTDDFKELVTPHLVSMIKVDGSSDNILKTGKTTWVDISGVYAAVTEFKKGKGSFIICQLKLNNRTKSNPTAKRFALKLIGGE